MLYYILTKVKKTSCHHEWLFKVGQPIEKSGQNFRLSNSTEKKTFSIIKILFNID